MLKQALGLMMVLVAPIAWAGIGSADGTVLAQVIVCPQSQVMLKSNKITLTDNGVSKSLTFDIQSGPWRDNKKVQLVFDVLNVRPVGVIQRGLEVTYEAKDVYGQPYAEKITIYRDHTEDSTNGKMYSGDCQ